MSEEQPIVADGKVVRIHYVLRDERGEIVDRSGEEPMSYLHGARNIVPGLERQLAGKAPGDSLEAVVPPHEGYGERARVKPQTLRRSELGDGVVPRKGMGLVLKGPDGKRVPVWVTKVMGASVVVEPNHPLAGKTLRFEVTVVDIRDAQAEELAHGHPHGPGGHAH